MKKKKKDPLASFQMNLPLVEFFFFYDLKKTGSSSSGWFLLPFRQPGNLFGMLEQRALPASGWGLSLPETELPFLCFVEDAGPGTIAADS